MGFATVVAMLSFFIALVALWLTSDIVKKVESHNEKFVRGHISSIREELRAIDVLLHKTARTTKQHDESQSVLDKRLNDQATAMDGVSEHMARLSDHLEELDQSIPQRYRVRKIKETVEDEPKPSIQ